MFVSLVYQRVYGAPLTPPTVGRSKVQVPKYGMTPFGRQVCGATKQTGGRMWKMPKKTKTSALFILFLLKFGDIPLLCSVMLCYVSLPEGTFKSYQLFAGIVVSFV